MVGVSANFTEGCFLRPSLNFTEELVERLDLTGMTLVWHEDVEDTDDSLPRLPHPRNTKPATEGSLAKLKRIVGSWGKSSERQQAVPIRRPSISGPYPMYCAPALREHGRNAVRPARSCASIRSTGSASSGTSFRSIWDKFTRPDG